MTGQSLDDQIELFWSIAEQLAAPLNCVVAESLPAIYDMPVCESIDEALAKAKEMSHIMAMVCDPSLRIRSIRDIHNGTYIAAFGFAADGTPKLCIMRGAATVLIERTEEQGYAPFLVPYRLEPNGFSPNGSGPAVPHKP